MPPHRPAAPALRPFEPARDRPAVAELWRAALHPVWPVLPAAVGWLDRGFLAERTDGTPAGFVGVTGDSVQLLLVAPDEQRRGIGGALLAAALGTLRAAGAERVTAGDGGGDYLWPGVPLDLPAAVRFFAGQGWQATHDTVDLTADLRAYRAPPGMIEAAARAGATLSSAPADRADVLAFERATFPSWTHWYERASGTALVARDRDGRIVGTLLYGGPGAATLYEPLLGPAAGTIGAVGVAASAQGTGIGSAMVARASELLRERGTAVCHIGWTEREAFYTRTGYHPWRRYRMFHRRLER